MAGDVRVGMMARLRSWTVLALLVVVVVGIPGVACSSDQVDDADVSVASPTVIPSEAATATTVASASPAATSTLIPGLSDVIDALLSPFNEGFDPHRIARIGESEDVRFAWIISDMLRFTSDSSSLTALEGAFWELTGVEEGSIRVWTGVTNYLIAEDVPPPEGYQRWKSMLYTRFGEEWAPFFDDPDAAVDWRLISWGGVSIDDRPVDEADRQCFTCIPALDDPNVTDAAGGSWYPDERLVFGVVVDGEARAYPKHQIEVHEMVNDTLGGRRIGLVYCTLCGTAQAFFTDEVPEGIDTPTGVFELRTSGLLSRSNKVMFELHTFSFFDTFRGRAVSGPLQDVGTDGLTLEPVSVSVATWGEWKAGHPETTIVAEDGGLGRRYPLDPLRGRDDHGPIFPVGDVDPRLPVQDQVLGVRYGEVTVAFPEIATRVALTSGDAVRYEGIEVRLEAGALAAFAPDGTRIETHQSFWFAWSQFWPETAVWGAE